MLTKVLSGLFNGVLVAGVMTMSVTSWPASADTTGIEPEYTAKIQTDQYLMDTLLVDGPISAAEMECLIQNMYFEARSDGYAGMYAVTMVVLNRVDDTRYPDTICGVVQQGPTKESWKTRQHPELKDSERVYYPVRNRCQFSWYCDGKSDDMNDVSAFTLATDIATLVADVAASNSNGYGYPTDVFLLDITEGATHYHANYVSPNWRNDRGMEFITRVGTHLFYRWNQW